MKTQKHFQHNQLITQITAANTGSSNPSSRQDAILLLVWFEKMLLLIQESVQTKEEGEEIGRDEYYQMLQLVMNIAVKELQRQVSV